MLHGFPPRFLTHTDAGIPNMFFTDVFTGTIDGRAITVANVRTPMEAMSLEYMAKVHSTSLVVLEMTTLVPYSVEPGRGTRSSSTSRCRPATPPSTPPSAWPA